MVQCDQITTNRTYSIAELSALSAVSFRTLRFYEERELLRPLRYGYIRRFTEKDRMRLEVVLKAKRLGFTLAEIWELLHARDLNVSDATGDLSDLGLTQDAIEDRIGRLTLKRTNIVDAIEVLSASLAKSVSTTALSTSGSRNIC